MPELPEVEILKSEINEQVVGKRVANFFVRKTGKTSLDGEELLPKLVGSKVTGATRRGKMLVVGFDAGLSLVIHMMLIGQTLLIRGSNTPSPTASLALHFADGDSLEVRQVALKALHLVETEALGSLPSIAELGIDALSSDLSQERFCQRLSGRRGNIKSLLMDQSLIAGIGNTYTDEILFLARVHPERDVRSLNAEELGAIFTQIGPTLRRGMEFGGSSAEQFLHLDGSPGRYQEHFQVHRRGGEPCHLCGTPIAKTTVGGRSAYFCSRCQKKG